MLLDRPGRFLYRHGVNLYGVMRILCTDYRYFVAVGVVLVAALIIRLILTNTGVLNFLGVAAATR